MKRNILMLALAGVASGALAQSFVNGDFTGGDLTGWTITPTANGQTLTQDVIPFDIDFGGPLGMSNVARFRVGQVAPQSGVPAGIEFTQVLSLISGTQYEVSFNAAAYRNSATNNAQGGIFDLIVENTVLATWAAGGTSSATTNSSLVSGQFVAGGTGNFNIGVRIQRPFTIPADLYQVVDNFEIAIVPEPGTFVALGLGVVGLLVARRRK
jgi:hypothetical protein